MTRTEEQHRDEMKRLIKDMMYPKPETRWQRIFGTFTLYRKDTIQDDFINFQKYRPGGYQEV